MSKDKDQDLIWEFSFRNFDPHIQMFSVHHADCGGAPYIDGRARCWHETIGMDLQGDVGNPTYTPRKYLLKIDQMGDIIADAIMTGVDVLVAVFSEGEDVAGAVVDILNLTNSVEEFKDYDVLNDIDNLAKKMEEQFEAACSAIGRTPDNIKAIAKKMGLTNYGFIAGDAYQKLIHDNSDINNGHGWTVLRTEVEDHKQKYKANAVFVYREKLIYYWNSSDMNGFWNKK